MLNLLSFLMSHEMKLQSQSFDQIQAGTKAIEVKLGDEKRPLVKIGDQTLLTEVTNLCTQPDLLSLFQGENPEVFGGSKTDTPEELVEMMRKYFQNAIL